MKNQRFNPLFQYRVTQGCLATYKSLLIILLFAVAIRLVWMFYYTSVIEEEGAYYAAIAENLLQGKGYASLSGRPNLVYPPLFPLLIAAMSFVKVQSDIAGRLVSTIFGTLLVLPVFFIALHLYGRKVAFTAGGLIACHPFLVSMSATVYSEATYLTLLIAGVYWGLRSQKLENPIPPALSGICLGLAYLTRPDAFIFPFMAVLFIAVTNRNELRKALNLSCVLLASFGILAIPYVAFLSLQMGQLRIEGKSADNYKIGELLAAGVPPGKIYYAIDENLRDRGLSNMSNLEVIQSTHISLQEAIRFAQRSARKNLPVVVQGLTSSIYLGQPLLLGLVFIGLFRRRWSYHQLIQQIFLLATIGCFLLTLLTIQIFHQRFLFPFLPVLIIWASKGIYELSRWAQATVRVQRRAIVRSGWIGIILSLTSALLFLLIALVGILHLGGDPGQRGPHQGLEKNVGIWLRNVAPETKRIMSTGPIIAFYSRSFLTPFPYSDSSLALKYINEKKMDFVVLRSTSRNAVPYLRDWIENGIPDRRAELIYTASDATSGLIWVYRWHALSR